LVERLQSGESVVVDVRPEEEFRAGHLPEAIHLPLEDLEARLHVLPMEQEVIAYCRGPFCTLSDHAVELLMANGFRARRFALGFRPAGFALGFPDWRAAGLPIAQS